MQWGFSFNQQTPLPQQSLEELKGNLQAVEKKTKIKNSVCGVLTVGGFATFLAAVFVNGFVPEAKEPTLYAMGGSAIAGMLGFGGMLDMSHLRKESALKNEILKRTIREQFGLPEVIDIPYEDVSNPKITLHKPEKLGL